MKHVVTRCLTAVLGPVLLMMLSSWFISTARVYTARAFVVWPMLLCYAVLGIVYALYCTWIMSYSKRTNVWVLLSVIAGGVIGIGLQVYSFIMPVSWVTIEQYLIMLSGELTICVNIIACIRGYMIKQES